MTKRKKLTPAEIKAALIRLPGWDVKEGKLHKQFKFGSFAQALGWMVSVGVKADKMNHHPEWSNVYNRVTVNLVTHDMNNAISSRDVELARRMERLAGLYIMGKRATIKYKAGIVPYRRLAAGEFEVLLVTARSVKSSWIFPVGTIDSGEAASQAAARECLEESGYIVRVEQEIGEMELQKQASVHHFTFFMGLVTGEEDGWEQDRQRQWVTLPALSTTIAPVFREIAASAASRLQPAK